MFGLTEELPPPLQDPLTTPLSNGAAVKLTSNNGLQRRLLRASQSRSNQQTSRTCSNSEAEQKQKTERKKRR